jgi:hypothetical protein
LIGFASWLFLNLTYPENCRIVSFKVYFVLVIMDARASSLSSLSENAELGTILRPVMYISSFDRKKLQYETFIFGDYAFVHLPDLIVNQEQTHFLGRKQRSKITSQLVVNNGTLGSSFLNIYMPNNFTMATDDISLHSKLIFYMFMRLSKKWKAFI